MRIKIKSDRSFPFRQNEQDFFRIRLHTAICGAQCFCERQFPWSFANAKRDEKEEESRYGTFFSAFPSYQPTQPTNHLTTYLSIQDYILLVLVMAKLILLNKMDSTSLGNITNLISSNKNSKQNLIVYTQLLKLWYIFGIS